MKIAARFLNLTLACALALPAWAAEPSQVPPAQTSAEEPFFSWRIYKHPERKRGLYWRPIVSVLVPGLDQWMEGQYRSAIVYTGYAAVGAGVMFSGAIDLADDVKAKKEISPLDNRARRMAWGGQAYMDIGFVSAYHSFRKSAELQKQNGKFLFLSHEETAGELMLAPLHFEHLLKPSIFIPLGIMGALAAVSSNREVDSTTHRKPVWRGDDMAWAAGMSVNAGVGEEALFRGYLMPMFREGWGTDFWSNTATAAIFAAAHVSGANPIPWPQFVIGWYLGWRVQQSEWKLSQSVFLHTWWDVLAIGASFANERGKAVYVPIVNGTF